ncbi:RNA polymerase sigma factor [Actinoallomurus sp. CA-142502]|uniref:RNA polymerase sigma factor n=1 Tax=Actinoallomurus sp. CA-142502 TaxID=3239885 RepID=UPI003D93EA0F
MPGWPSIDRAEDERLAQSLWAGEMTALPEIYDAYAPRLFDYCHVLLRDEEAAGLALHDALITVQERIGDLPDVRLFRGWLYAVTRRECLRRRAQDDLPAHRRPAAEADGFGGDDAIRRLVHTALLVLDGSQREALDLSLRHELDSHELAEILSVLPHEASVRVAQARQDLDHAFTAVVVAATGRKECPSVAEMAGSIDEPLDAEAYGSIARHIANCRTCSAHGNRKVATARLLDEMPTAALPAALRAHVLNTAVAPESANLRHTIALRAEPPADGEPGPEPQRRRRSTPGLVPAIVACCLLIVGGILLVRPGSGQSDVDGEQAIGASESPGSAAPGGASPSDSAIPSPSRTSGDGGGGSKDNSTAVARPSRTPAPTPPRRSPTPPPPPPQRPGTLSVSGCRMNDGDRCSATVTAHGGPAEWRVTGTSANVSAGGSGTLTAGQTAYVTVTRRVIICLGGGSGSVSFNSGAHAPVTWDC